MIHGVVEPDSWNWPEEPMDNQHVQSKYKCPHCGWTYDPSKHEDGFSFVPDHLADSYDRLMSCEGALEHPRNAESDRRPLWKDGGVK